MREGELPYRICPYLSGWSLNRLRREHMNCQSPVKKVDGTRDRRLITHRDLSNE
jgi:hypothetical protein